MAEASIHDRAAVLSIGDELVLGQTLDTNSRWISERLTARGVRAVEHVTVPDDLDAHAAALARLAASVPLVVSTGGLGPTADDLSRDALARVMGETLVEDGAAWQQIRSHFVARGVPVSENNRLQALRPASAAALANPHGTAPGLFATIGGRCDVFCLPGPPNEMKPMFEAEVLSRLRPPAGRVVRTRVLRTFGMGESHIAERLGQLMDRSRNPLVGTTASEGVVSCRIRYEGPDAGADGAVEDSARAVRDALGAIVYGEEDDSLASVIVGLLRERGERLVVVESCTGGLLGAMITEVPGCSDAFLGGWITYANEAKSAHVGVPAETIARHGAVSAEVARAMAAGALLAAGRSGPAHALAITGVAGPGGGSDAKPVGTVWICRASTGNGGAADTDARRFLFSGDRAMIRRRSAMTALAMLRLFLIGEGGLQLIRQQSP